MHGQGNPALNRDGDGDAVAYGVAVAVAVAGGHFHFHFLRGSVEWESAGVQVCRCAGATNNDAVSSFSYYEYISVSLHHSLHSLRSLAVSALAVFVPECSLQSSLASVHKHERDIPRF